MEYDIVELKRQVQIFLYASDLCLDVRVHLTLVRVFLAAMVDNTLIDFPVLVFAYFKPDLVLYRKTHLLDFIPLHRYMHFFIHLDSLLF